MRSIVLAAITAAGVALFGMATASAAPASGHAMSQLADHSRPLTLAAAEEAETRGVCRLGWHRGKNGRCRPNRK